MSRLSSRYFHLKVKPRFHLGLLRQRWRGVLSFRLISVIFFNKVILKEPLALLSILFGYIGQHLSRILGTYQAVVAVNATLSQPPFYPLYIE